MNRKFHGILSLTLVGVAIILGLFSITRESLLMGLLYVAISAVSSCTVVYAFCAKCPCRLHDCAHVLPVKLTTLLPPRKEGPYTALDLIGMSVPLLLIFLFPQFWLWKNPIFLIIFWVLCVVVSIEIVCYVCKGCQNEYCPLCALRNG
jgi:hypothetical protein